MIDRGKREGKCGGVETSPWRKRGGKLRNGASPRLQGLSGGKDLLERGFWDVSQGEKNRRGR